MLELLRKILAVFTPIIYGVALAYFLSPMQNFFEKKVFRFKSEKKFVLNLRRALSITATFLTVLIILTAAVAIFIPQIIDSYQRLNTGLPGYIQNLDDNLEKDLSRIFSGNRFFENFYNGLRETLGADEDHTLFSQIVARVSSWLVNLASVDNVNKLLTMGASVITVVVDVILSVIFAIYLLAAKEKHLARTKKLLTAFLSEAKVKETYRVAYLADEKIGRYIRVQVIDSIIVGIVSYFVYWIFGLPFYPMLALISGVTNIIPIFGPYIGAIPNGLFILLAAPNKLLPFIIIVAVVQILDGNVLVPLLQSSNMKMDKFWVLAAITIMGGFFGLPGMILGVPICAVIYILIKERAEKKLAEKQLATQTVDYVGPYMPEQLKKNRASVFKELFARIFKRKKKKGQADDGRADGATPPAASEGPPPAEDSDKTPADPEKDGETPAAPGQAEDPSGAERTPNGENGNNRGN